MGLDLTVFCQIKSHSHELIPEAFEGLQNEKCNLRAYDITDSTFFLGIHSGELPVKSSDEYTAYASFTLSYFLMALNIATLGHFEWASKTSEVASYSIVDNEKHTASGIISNNAYEFPRDAHSKLHAGYIARAASVFAALSHEAEEHIRTEYLKGVFHLGHTFFDLEFRKEAFANFYRSLEYFVTSRLLGKRKLSNEIKDFKTAFNKIGLDHETQEMFRTELYPLRSSQVMHSQTKQREIEWDDAIKMKMMADVVMHEHYKPIWERELR